MSKKYLWMAVSSDEFELPMCVRDSCKELAAVYNLSIYAVYQSINGKYSGIIRGVKFIKIPLNDEDIEND